MNTQIELSSIAMSKNDPKITKLDKYDVDANIEEVDNSEDQSIFKYGFTALSNPKNVRLALEGIAKISGDSVERNEILEKDENGVPKILTMIYHELFPTFFLLSKTLNVSCPPHTIGEMNNSPVVESVDVIRSTETDEPVFEELQESVAERSKEIIETTIESTENTDITQSAV